MSTIVDIGWKIPSSAASIKRIHVCGGGCCHTYITLCLSSSVPSIFGLGWQSSDICNYRQRKRTSPLAPFVPSLAFCKTRLGIRSALYSPPSSPFQGTPGMGLTLHYTLSCPSRPATEVRDLVEKLRKHALSLPFQNVSKVIELTRDECQFRRDNKGDPHAWLKVQTIRFQVEEDGDVIRSTTESNPIHIIAFTVQPGEGSEPANFGLCQYPRKTGWSWSSFCKTQYASNPSVGDVANFLKCHLGLTAVLDKAREMEILGEVNDEGKYWQNRDVEALVKEVGMWNRMIAGFYGQLRDAVEAAGGDPRAIVGEIAKFRDFERLEMEGRKTDN